MFFEGDDPSIVWVALCVNGHGEFGEPRPPCDHFPVFDEVAHGYFGGVDEELALLVSCGVPFFLGYVDFFWNLGWDRWCAHVNFSLDRFPKVLWEGGQR